MCAVVQSSALAVWPRRCGAGESKQLGTCTEHRWQDLNMSEHTESPTTSTMQQSKHMACTSNFTRVLPSVVCCGPLRFLSVPCDGKWQRQHVQLKRKSDRSMITAMLKNTITNCSYLSAPGRSSSRFPSDAEQSHAGETRQVRHR